ncbi:MAG: hypothetical protein V4638_02750 [Bacteroidota bacterium]
MTSKIQQLINDISRKQSDLQKRSLALNVEKDQLAVELSQLKSENQALKDQMESHLAQIADLKNELATEKIQVVEKTVVSTKRNDEEIDELVKEIEFCINQLKNNG